MIIEKDSLYKSLRVEERNALYRFKNVVVRIEKERERLLSGARKIAQESGIVAGETLIFDGQEWTVTDLGLDGLDADDDNERGYLTVYVFLFRESEEAYSYRCFILNDLINKVKNEI